MNIQSFKVPIVPFYYHCSGNVNVPVILRHPKDVTLHHFSNVRMRFSCDLHSILEPFLWTAMVLWRTLWSALCLHLLFSQEQTCLCVDKSVLCICAVCYAWWGYLSTVIVFCHLYCVLSLYVVLIIINPHFCAFVLSFNWIFCESLITQLCCLLSPSLVYSCFFFGHKFLIIIG